MHEVVKRFFQSYAEFIVIHLQAIGKANRVFCEPALEWYGFRVQSHAEFVRLESDGAMSGDQKSMPSR